MAGAMALTTARSVAPEFSLDLGPRAQRLVVQRKTDVMLAAREAIR